MTTIRLPFRPGPGRIRRRNGKNDTVDIDKMAGVIVSCLLDEGSFFLTNPKREVLLELARLDVYFSYVGQEVFNRIGNEANLDSRIRSQHCEEVTAPERLAFELGLEPQPYRERARR